jgi:rhodanese-related sulfurtransferase
MSKNFNKINILYLVSALLLLGLLSGCSNVTTEINKASFTKIKPEDAKKRLDSEKGIVLLDVRTKEEYDTGYIKGSILIPLDNVKEEAERKLKDKDAPIFVYCRSGNRSTSAASILANLGYKNVYNLGGINNWPYEVVEK